MAIGHSTRSPGPENPHGLGATFYDDGRQVWTEVSPAEHHQGWPGVLHGGVVTAILDETIGRVGRRLIAPVMLPCAAERVRRHASAGNS